MAPGDAAGRPRGRRPPSQAWLAYAFIGPAMVLFLAFVLGPFIAAMVLSFFSWDLLTPAEYIGLDNFRRLVTDPVLYRSLANTFVFAFASVVLHVGGALVLSLAVNSIVNKALSYFLRAALLFPFLISWAAVSLLWKYILDPEFGFIGYYLGQLGIESPNWFSDPAWALPAIIGIDFWHTIGFTFLIMLAGLQTVPKELLEAARTDGANRWQSFFNVTLPLLSPTIFFATIITFIGAFQVFDPIQIITGGGPDDSTVSVVMYLYRTGFQSFQVGYASAIALLVFFVIMGVTVLQFMGSRKWVHEQ